MRLTSQGGTHRARSAQHPAPMDMTICAARKCSLNVARIRLRPAPREMRTPSTGSCIVDPNSVRSKRSHSRSLIMNATPDPNTATPSSRTRTATTVVTTRRDYEIGSRRTTQAQSEGRGHGRSLTAYFCGASTPARHREWRSVERKTRFEIHLDRAYTCAGVRSVSTRSVRGARPRQVVVWTSRGD